MRRPSGWEWTTIALTVMAIAVMGFLSFQGARSLEEQREAVETLKDQAERSQQRTEAAEERIERAVDRIIDEVRSPQSEAGDTREETFSRIRRLCEVHVGCEP